ncbi:RAB26-like protein, partial [Mya arenaria]
TILVGDSGVGKTSLLVQFDQGKFQVGSFSATVGIGFTVRHQVVLGNRRYRVHETRPRLRYKANDKRSSETGA